MFNLDELFLKDPRRGRADAAKPPARGARRFFFLAYTHFAKLVGLNMLFLLFCVPVITIPAALSGMNRVCILLVMNGRAEVWNDFIAEFKGCFLKSLPFGLGCAFLLADAGLCAYLGLASVSAGLAIPLYAAAVILTVATLLLGSYCFTLLPLVSLRSTDILRNAVLLMLLEPKSDLLLVLLVGGMLVAAALLTPFSVPVIAVILFSLISLAACTILSDLIQNRVIGRG